MIRFTRSQLQPIGIDIGHDAVKMLQVEVVGTALAAVAVAREPLPDEARENPDVRLAAAADIVRRLLRRGRFHGRRVVAALPRHLVQVKNLRLPAMPAAEVANAVRYEARNLFGFDPDQAALHHLVAGEVRQGNDLRQELVVFAAPNPDVATFLEQLHRAGAQVESLDVEPCALFRSVERFIRRKEDQTEVHVLVDVGQQRSHVLIGRGTDLTFFKPIDIAAHHLTDAISRKLGIAPDEARALRRRLIDAPDDAPAARRDPVRQAVFDATRSVFEDLGREVALCLRYYTVTFRGQRPARVRLFGGGACDPQLQALLGAALAIPVETARPLYSVDTSRLPPALRQGPLCEWATALGLSLRFTTQKFAPRDGKPRDARGAQVVDLNQAVQSVAAGGGAFEPAAAAGEAARA